MNIDLTDIFDDDLLGNRPATFIVDATDADSATHEIAVSFARDGAVSSGMQNAAPTAWARTMDLPGLTNKSGLIIHYGYRTTESGEPLLAEDGEPVIAENEFTYKVMSYHSDAFGVTMMELSLTTGLST
jgi:hypothetical protein